MIRLCDNCNNSKVVIVVVVVVVGVFSDWISLHHFFPRIESSLTDIDFLSLLLFFSRPFFVLLNGKLSIFARAKPKKAAFSAC